MGFIPCRVWLFLIRVLRTFVTAFKTEVSTGSAFNTCSSSIVQKGGDGGIRWTMVFGVWLGLSVVLGSFVLFIDSKQSVHLLH